MAHAALEVVAKQSIESPLMPAAEYGRFLTLCEGVKSKCTVWRQYWHRQHLNTFTAERRSPRWYEHVEEFARNQHWMDFVIYPEIV